MIIPEDAHGPAIEISREAYQRFIQPAPKARRVRAIAANMSEPLEYSYEEKSDHLSEEEALEQYTRAKREHPNALITLRDLDCGHWQIGTYETADEKNAFLTKQLASMVRTFWSSLRLKPKTP